MTPRHIQDTSRTKQETDLSVHASDPSARVLSTRGLDVLKEPDSAERFKKVSAKSKVKEKKVTAVSKWALKIASADSADMDQTAAKIT